MLMSRIVSLALDEALLEALDHEAKKRSLNRSELMNTLLAQRYGALTPKIKQVEMMDRLTEALERFGRVTVLSAKRSGALQYRSTVLFAYRPKVRFILSFGGQEERDLGHLRVVTRSTSVAFCDALWAFFSLVNGIETRGEVARRPGIPGTAPYRRIGTGIEKVLRRDKGDHAINVERATGELYQYLCLVQRSLDIYFEYLDAPEVSNRMIEAKYRQFFKGGEVT